MTLDPRIRKVLALTLVCGAGACLDDQAPHLDCGQGSAYAFSGADYCIYPAAIIIEGFDCPLMVPFGHETDGFLICGPSESPPEEGWQELVESWQEHVNPRPGDGSDASEGDASDSGPDTAPGLCVAGLAPGECWSADQCPSAWACAGGDPGCTPCVDCPDPIPGTRGTCRPASGSDALGLVPWPGFQGAAGDVPIAYWFIADAFYSLLECPSWTLELSDGAGGFTLGPNEGACIGAETPPASVVIARPGAPLGNVATVVVRASGHYRTNCVGADPASCGGQVDLVSDPVELRGSGQ